MIRYFIPFTLLCATLAFASCGDNEDNDIDVPTEEVVPGTNHNVLVAYFSEPLPDGVDASTSASRVIVNGDLYGSVEYMATVISETTGADIVRIQTATPYPGNFDDLASQADTSGRTIFTPLLPRILRTSMITMSSSWAIPSGGIRCRWQCIRSSMNTTLRARRSSLSRPTAEADGAARWTTLPEWSQTPRWWTVTAFRATAWQVRQTAYVNGSDG